MTDEEKREVIREQLIEQGRRSGAALEKMAQGDIKDHMRMVVEFDEARAYDPTLDAYEVGYGRE